MKKTLFVFVAILMSIAIALPLVNCTPKAPSQEKFVTYLSLSDLTGPGAGMVVPIVEAIGFAFDDLNSKGGVKGVKVNSIVVDTRYDTARTVSAYKRYRTEPRGFWAFIPLTLSLIHI